jgi:hypothetical protein
METIRKIASTDGWRGARVATYRSRRCAMTLIDHETELDNDKPRVDRPGVRVARASLAAGETACECPDFCPVQHDDN